MEKKMVVKVVRGVLCKLLMASANLRTVFTWRSVHTVLQKVLGCSRSIDSMHNASRKKVKKLCVASNKTASLISQRAEVWLL